MHRKSKGLNFPQPLIKHPGALKTQKCLLSRYTPVANMNRKIPHTYQPFFSVDASMEPCPHIFRPSCYTTPGHLNNIIDFGVIVQPFAPCCNTFPVFPSVRCQKCKTPFNCHMQCQQNGRIKCNICHTLNDSTFQQQKTLQKIQNYAVYDSKICPSPSQTRFILAIEATHRMTEKIQTILQLLPTVEIQIAIVLFGYDIRVILPHEQPQLVVLTDLQDIVLPHIFFSTKDTRLPKITTLIQQIIQNNTNINNSMRNQCLKYLQKWYKQCHILLFSKNKYNSQPQSYDVAISSFIFYQSPDQKITMHPHNGGSIYLYHLEQSTQFYYDLYDLLTLSIFSNVQVKVHTNNMKCTSVSYDFRKNNKDTIKLLTFSQRHNLTVNLETSSHQQCDFVMEISYTKHNYQYVRCISYKFHKNQNDFNSVGDQALFYLMHRNIVQNQNSVKSHSLSKLKKIMKKIKQCNSSNFDFSIPSTLKHCYFYAGMMDQLCLLDNSFLENSITWYKNRHDFCSLDLETLSKQIYMKMYRIDQKQLKNIKMQAHKVEMDGVYLVDSGKVLYLIIGQEVTLQQYLQITGLQSQNDVLDGHIEIPDNGSVINKKLRDTVALLRQCNKNRHLRIQTIVQGTPQYQKTIIPQFFNEDAYRRFLSRLI